MKLKNLPVVLTSLVFSVLMMTSCTSDPETIIETVVVTETVTDNNHDSNNDTYK